MTTARYSMPGKSFQRMSSMLGTLSPNVRACVREEDELWSESELEYEENQWEAVVEEIIKYG